MPAANNISAMRRSTLVYLPAAAEKEGRKTVCRAKGGTAPIT
jgi:hypothetical protein